MKHGPELLEVRVADPALRHPIRVLRDMFRDLFASRELEWRSIFCIGFVTGIVLTPLGLLYNDVAQALPMALGFLMLFTPVVYMPPSSGFLGVLMQINPLSSLIMATRDLLLVGATTLLPEAAAIFGGTLVLLVLGWVLYRLAMPILIERIGN